MIRESFLLPRVRETPGATAADITQIYKSKIIGQKFHKNLNEGITKHGSSNRSRIQIISSCLSSIISINTAKKEEKKSRFVASKEVQAAGLMLWKRAVDCETRKPACMLLCNIALLFLVFRHKRLSVADID